MGRVCLVCEGAVDSSTHSSHIPRYKAKYTGTCSLVKKKADGTVLPDWGLWEGRAGPDQSSSLHMIVLITAECAPPTQPLALSGCTMHFDLK